MRAAIAGTLLLLLAVPALGQEKKKKKEEGPALAYPPALPEGKTVATDQSPEFLRSPGTLREGVEIAKAAPTIDFAYYPGQDYAGKPWSVWGDGCAAGDKYFSAIGDHHSPRGSASVYEYDATTKKLRALVNLRAFLESSDALPKTMNYTPGKVHSRVDLGGDGWLYYATHRGSPTTTNDSYGYLGDFIFRTHPEGGKTEVVAAFPVEKHAIPMSVLDPERLIFYGGTAAGKNAPLQDVVFFAYDVRAKRRILSAGGGPERCAIFSKSTGCVYWKGKVYDPQQDYKLSESKAPDVRSATQETPQGVVYGTTGHSAEIWAFDVKTETLTGLGSGAVGKQEYVTSLDVDPTGRYLYYAAGAHGGAGVEGCPVVQFDVRTRKRKVIAFLDPFYRKTYGYMPDGTFSSAVDPKGEKLYITWNGSRKPDPKGSKDWEACALTVIHIPASERP